MQPMDDIADILLQIMQAGIVMARSAGWDKNVERATMEADHVHNLPDVLRRYDPEKLVYYWDKERISYRDQFMALMGRGPEVFTDLWTALEPLMSQVRAELPPVSSFHTAMDKIVEDFVADLSGRANE